MLETVLKVLVALFLISSFKYLPGVYFFRFYMVPIRYLFLKKPADIAKLKSEAKGNPSILWDPVNRYTYCCPMECDFFGFHKNNGTYQTELDICRTEVILDKLYPFFINFKKTQNGRIPYVPLATLGIHFIKEISPFQKYYMENRILSWDNKWIFTLTLFKVGDRICSASVGKLVFKDGRKTIPPQEVIDYCGYSSDEVEKVRLENLKTVQGYIDPTVLTSLTFGAKKDD